MEKSVLFVCMGNICRSPAADGIFSDMVAARGLSAGYYIDSAGTYGGHAGELPDKRMREAGVRRGYDFTHRSRQVSPDDFHKFDIILAMDDRNYEHLFRMAPTLEAREKIHRMVEFGGQKGYNHIPDPYYEGREGFDLVLDLLEHHCAALLDLLTNQSV